MADHCGYDCAKPPATVPPNADISGIGVVTGYVATAGLAIVIIAVFFLFAHDPDNDPFQNQTCVQVRSRTSAFRPNPVDVAIFGSFRRRTLQPRFKDAALKCVLAMSDLQILTGYSILISGYLQLNCGLSAYHWQMLVNLAWFSSLTHLSCLTFLRSYLYHRHVERTWRLIAMGLLIVLLVFALIPTGNYAWGPAGSNSRSASATPGPTPSDYARCHYFYGPRDIVDNLTFVSMILSVLLVVCGFLIRLVKLHRRLISEALQDPCSGILYTGQLWQAFLLYE
ncbi:hypothetical protein NQ176_g3350 [Zarea fungicola]|uniref:Uncharacterized protein n=1 Tax=Zarea fungicola TaxID=93591 RepID=A0ACC1NK44_9HYPO|nr:hypothetical protein NQ176_g3350 [Lecanicillium fungicola]